MDDNAVQQPEDNRAENSDDEIDMFEPPAIVYNRVDQDNPQVHEEDRDEPAPPAPLPMPVPRHLPHWQNGALVRMPMLVDYLEWDNNDEPENNENNVNPDEEEIGSEDEDVAGDIQLQFDLQMEIPEHLRNGKA